MEGCCYPRHKSAGPNSCDMKLAETEGGIFASITLLDSAFSRCMDKMYPQQYPSRWRGLRLTFAALRAHNLKVVGSNPGARKRRRESLSRRNHCSPMITRLFFNGIGHGPTFSDCADSSLCRVKLDPNALIKERYVGMSTAKLIQSRRRPNGNIAIRHLEYCAEKWQSITLDCHSNFHRRAPLLSV
jgi:hypothetical protein